MKSSFLLLLLLSFYIQSYSQNMVLNGSFEINTASANTINISNDWNTYVPNSWNIGSGIQDLLMTDLCGGGSDGNWFVHTTTEASHNYTSFSLELSTQLNPGGLYRVSYDYRTCSGETCILSTSIAKYPNITGTVDVNYMHPQPTLAWTTYSYVFVSSSAGKYLSVNPDNTIIKNMEMDNFKVEDLTTTGIPNLESIGIGIYPNPGHGLINFNTTGLFNNKKCEILICDLTGKIIFSQQFDALPNSLELNNIGSGFYLLNLNCDGNQVREKLIIE